MEGNSINNIVVEWNGPKAILRPVVNFVAAVVPQLRTVLRAVVAKGVEELTIDFARVQMVDSSGLGLLIAAHNTVAKNGGRLAVIHVQKEILELLRSMRIHQHFAVSGDEAGLPGTPAQ